jgi:hypothetical protein
MPRAFPAPLTSPGIHRRSKGLRVSTPLCPQAEDRRTYPKGHDKNPAGWRGFFVWRKKTPLPNPSPQGGGAFPRRVGFGANSLFSNCQTRPILSWARRCPGLAPPPCGGPKGERDKRLAPAGWGGVFVSLRHTYPFTRLAPVACQRTCPSSNGLRGIQWLPLM